MTLLDPFLRNKILNAPLVRLPLCHQDAFPISYALNHFGKFEKIVRAENHVDGFLTLEDGLAFLLRNTSSYADDEVVARFLEVAQTSQLAVDFVLGVMTH